MINSHTDNNVEKQDVVHALRQLLERGDELDRCCACRSLGVLGRHEATDGLIARLRDDDIDVCIDAAESLGKLGNPVAVEPLIESLRNDPDSDVKVAVVEALGALGGEHAASILIDLLAAPPEVDDWDDDDGWDSNWDIQRKAAQALGYLRITEAVPVLSTMLDDEEGQVDETDIVLALARIGDAGEALVIQRLQDGSIRERRRAAHALGQACSAPGAHALGRALQDPAPEVRGAAAEALGRSGQSRYLGALLLLLRDPADEVRETVLKVATRLSAHINADLDMATLLPLLHDPSARIRAAVLDTLPGPLPRKQDENSVFDTDTQVRIQSLIQDPEPRVAAAAIPHTTQLDAPDVEDILLNLLGDTRQDPAVRQQAALALGRRPDTTVEILEALDRAVSDPESIVHWAALRALMMHHKHHTDPAEETPDGTVRALDYILAALRGEQITAAPQPTEEAETSNEEIPAETPIIAPESESATAETAEETAPVSTLGAIALANEEYAQRNKHQKPPANSDIPELPAEEMADFRELYDILDQHRHDRKKFYRGKHVDVAADVRRLSIRILGECSQAEVIEALSQTLHEDNPELQQEAMDALARMAPGTPGLTETLGPLASYLHLGSSELRVASARALGAIGNLNHLQNLRECLRDENPLVRSQAVLAVGQILEQHAVPDSAHSPLHVSDRRTEKQAAIIELSIRALSDCLSDSDVGVRKASALSLARLNKWLPDSELRNDIIDSLITAAFVGEGQQARDMGQALRVLDPDMAGEVLIQRLNTLPSSQERRFALEMLEEIFRPHQAA